MISGLLALSLSTASAEDVAAVLAVDGAVRIVSAAGTVDAAPRLSLDRASRVQTGEDGAVILLLANNRLVRVDEDLDLAVDDLVLLDAPKTNVPVKDQLADLLYPGERESMRGVEDAERIAGWQARLAAGTAVPAQAVAARLEATSASLAAPAEDAGPAPDDGDSGYVAADDALPSGGEAGRLQAESSDLPRFDAESVSALINGELARCMKDWRKADGLDKGHVVTLHFRVDGGRIVRIVGDDGVTPSRCLRDEILGGAASATFDVTVILP